MLFSDQQDGRIDSPQAMESHLTGVEIGDHHLDVERAKLSSDRVRPRGIVIREDDPQTTHIRPRLRRYDVVGTEE